MKRIGSGSRGLATQAWLPSATGLPWLLAQRAGRALVNSRTQLRAGLRADSTFRRARRMIAAN
eukprot:7228220-Lingulodinium_polyedra.AAC.1